MALGRTSAKVWRQQVDEQIYRLIPKREQKNEERDSTRSGKMIYCTPLVDYVQISQE